MFKEEKSEAVQIDKTGAESGRKRERSESLPRVQGSSPLSTLITAR